MYALFLSSVYESRIQELLSELTEKASSLEEMKEVNLRGSIWGCSLDFGCLFVTGILTEIGCDAVIFSPNGRAVAGVHYCNGDYGQQEAGEDNNYVSLYQSVLLSVICNFLLLFNSNAIHDF